MRFMRWPWQHEARPIEPSRTVNPRRVELERAKEILAEIFGIFEIFLHGITDCLAGSLLRLPLGSAYYFLSSIAYSQQGSPVHILLLYRRV